MNINARDLRLELQGRRPVTPQPPQAPPEIPIGGGFQIPTLPPILPRNLEHFSVTQDYQPGALFNWLG